MIRTPHVRDLDALLLVTGSMALITNYEETVPMHCNCIQSFTYGDTKQQALVLFGQADYFIVTDGDDGPKILDGIMQDSGNDYKPLPERVLNILLKYTLFGMVPTYLLEIVADARDNKGKNVIEKKYKEALDHYEEVLDDLS